ncbi:MAG TPA: penicillin-binding protein 2 [Myxococcales bacterium]|nr:penicillin-binding protein 2 [Myxococcales bacterium]
MNLRYQLGPSHDARHFAARNAVALAVVVVGIMGLGMRLLLVQVIHGERYEQFATIERVSKVRSTAPRGMIVGSKGDVLARNIESHRLEVLAHRVKKGRVRPIADTLRRLLDLTDSEYNGLLTELSKPVDPRRHKPIVVRRGLVSSHCPYDSHQLDLTGDHVYGFCPTCGRSYESVPKRHTCPVHRRKLVPSGNGDGLHCPVCAREFLDRQLCPYDDTPVHRGKHALRCAMCARTFNDEVAILRSHLHELPEARIQTEIQREYPYRYLASHLLGYVSRVSSRDMRPFDLDGPSRYSLNDTVGRTGLERALDALLRGVDGEQVLIRRGNQEEKAVNLDDLLAAMQPKQTVAGMNVKLTLDLALQRRAKVSMSHVHSGAAVALEVATGRVLALYSKPSFDPNAWSGRLTPEIKAHTDASPYAPLMNKALHAFPPASTYKVVTSAAALEEGLVTPKSTFWCPGYYEYGGRRFRCHKKSGHGEVDLGKAIEQSCDVYFYKLGEQLGIDRLATYGRKMGFGEPTGLEVYEQNGRVPNKDWYLQRYGKYFPGFALSTAVGQKDATATPLQLARVYAGLARGGSLPNVSLIDSLDKGDRKMQPYGRHHSRSMGLKPSTLKAIHVGLKRVVESGTARKSQLKKVVMAGKTGTAEAAQRAKPGTPPDIVRWLKDDHAWFVGFAPADKPRVVVAVFVEHGGHGGHVAAPIAKRIIKRYLQLHPTGPSYSATTAVPKVMGPDPANDFGLDHSSQTEPSP